MFDQAAIRAVTHMVRRHLRGIWIDGEMCAGPAVWAVNHHSWWDPFVTTAVIHHRDGRSAVLMRQENLEQFRFARAVGAFGTRQPRQGLDYLAQGRQLVIFPEGELFPPGPVRELADGAAWFAARAGVSLVAVALRVVLRGHQSPEAYLSFEPIAPGGTPSDMTRRLTAGLIRRLSHLDDRLDAADPRAPVPGFDLVLAGRSSPDERIAAWMRRMRWAN